MHSSDYDLGGDGVVGLSTSSEETIEITAYKKLPVNEQNLKRGLSIHMSINQQTLTFFSSLVCCSFSVFAAWEATQRSTRDDWTEWLRRFSVWLLKESPSPALRSCSALAQVYHPLARELFNAGFVSCWNELPEQYQAEVVCALELVCHSSLFSDF